MIDEREHSKFLYLMDSLFSNHNDPQYYKKLLTLFWGAHERLNIIPPSEELTKTLQYLEKSLDDGKTFQQIIDEISSMYNPPPGFQMLASALYGRVNRIYGMGSPGFSPPKKVW